jgi:hypothetical protein
MDQEQESTNQYLQERDRKLNSSTALPPEESVRVPSIWVFEAYTPSSIGNLQEGAERLGWSGSEILLNPDFPDAISNMRSTRWGGGWLNLGYIVPINDKQYLSVHRRAPLPPGVVAIQASVWQPFPSTTLLSCQFMLDDSLANSLEQPLAESFNTYREPIGKNSIRFVGVEHQKQNAVDLMREYLCSLCSDWVTEYFPGYFSSDMGGHKLPTCELILFSKHKDFSDLTYSHSQPNFLQMLNLHAPSNTWTNAELSNLYLQFAERKNQGPGRAVLFGNVNQILHDENLDMYGNDTREQKVVHRLQDLDHSLGTWVLGLIAQDFVAEMGVTRDAYGSLNISTNSLNTEKLRELDRRLLEFQRNAIPFAYDITAYCEHVGWFMHNVYEFHPIQKWGEFEQKLFGDMRQGLSSSATHIMSAEKQMRAIALQTGNIISSISNERLATTNLRLQNSMVWMTIVMLFLTVVMAQQQLKNFWYWLSY